MKVLRLGPLALIAAVCACAAPLPQVPTSFSPAGQNQGVPSNGVSSYADQGNGLQVTQAAAIEFGNGFSRQIKAGSRWRLVGQVPQGDVYKPLDQVFTIEGQHVDEAYIVLNQSRLVGFYLPARGSFSAASVPVTLSTIAVALPGVPQSATAPRDKAEPAAPANPTPAPAATPSPAAASPAPPAPASPTPAAAAPASPSAASPTPGSREERLKSLKDMGLISDEEMQAELKKGK